jgi:hypothetical protein
MGSCPALTILVSQLDFAIVFGLDFELNFEARMSIDDPKQPHIDPEDEGVAVPRRRGGDAPADPQATRRGLLIVIPLVMAGAAIVGYVLTGS